MPGANVFIGIKTRGRIIAHMFTWLGRTMQQAKGPDAKENEVAYVTVYNSIGKPEDVNQNSVFDRFLETNCTHLLCIDDDIMADEHLLERLVSYNLDIVASPVLIMGEKGVTYFASNFNKEDETYTTVDVFPPNNSLQECDAVGFGCILIKRHVVEKMPHPKYETVLTEKGFMKIPPDNQFCFKAKELGFKVHVDGTMMLGQISEVNLLYVLQGYPNFVPPIEEINKARTMHKWMQENMEDFSLYNPIIEQIFKSGIRIQQLPSELDQLLDFLKDFHIKTYLEIGRLDGGTLMLFSKFLGDEATLISVDIHPMGRSFAFPSNQIVRLIDGSSLNAETYDSVLRVLGRHQVDLLFIDGDHYNAERDFNHYKDLVRSGGYIVFHDIHPQKEGPESNTGTVPEFWQRVKKMGFNYWEFVKGDPTGYGIGVIEFVR